MLGQGEDLHFPIAWNMLQYIANNVDQQMRCSIVDDHRKMWVFARVVLRRTEAVGKEVEEIPLSDQSEKGDDHCGQANAPFRKTRRDPHGCERGVLLSSARLAFGMENV